MGWRNVCRRWKLKRIKAALPAILFLFSLLNVCSREELIVTVHLDVAELICEDGQKTFESRILDLEGIRSVTVNINTHMAEISFKDSDLSEPAIVDHLKAYGFSVNNQPGNAAARKRLPSCCLEN